MDKLHSCGVIVITYLIVLATSRPPPVNIADGKSLKDYLCSPEGTIPPNTSLVITVPMLQLPVSQGEFCRVENTSNIAIVASDKLIATSLSYVSVVCGNHTGFGFFNVTNLTIRSVYFENCENVVPASSVRYVNESGQWFYYDEDVWVTLIFNHCYNLTLHDVLAHSSLNITVDMIGVNLCGFSSIN